MTSPDGTGHHQSIKPIGRMSRSQARSVLARLTREWSFVMKRVKPEDRPMVMSAIDALLTELARP